MHTLWILNMCTISAKLQLNTQLAITFKWCHFFGFLFNSSSLFSFFLSISFLFPLCTVCLQLCFLLSFRNSQLVLLFLLFFDRLQTSLRFSFVCWNACILRLEKTFPLLWFEYGSYNYCTHCIFCWYFAHSFFPFQAHTHTRAYISTLSLSLSA